MVEGSAATKILVEFASGEVLSAEGETADKIWRWFMGCESMACIHGAKFQGKGFDVREAGNERGK